jgi:hypothetical protein
MLRGQYYDRRALIFVVNRTIAWPGIKAYPVNFSVRRRPIVVAVIVHWSAAPMLASCMKNFLGVPPDRQAGQ